MEKEYLSLYNSLATYEEFRRWARLTKRVIPSDFYKKFEPYLNQRRDRHYEPTEAELLHTFEKYLSLCMYNPGTGNANECVGSARDAVYAYKLAWYLVLAGYPILITKVIRVYKKDAIITNALRSYCLTQRWNWHPNVMDLRADVSTIVKDRFGIKQCHVNTTLLQLLDEEKEVTFLSDKLVEMGYKFEFTSN